MRWFLPLIVVATIATPAAGQTSSGSADVSLRSLLTAYESGDANRAVSGLVAMSPSALDAAVHDLLRAEARARRFDLLEVAAIALNEAAAVTLEHAGEPWRMLKKLSDEIGRQLLELGDRSPRLRAWCLAADALSEARRDFGNLTRGRLLADARTTFKDDAGILFASGSMYQTRAYARAEGVGPRGRAVTTMPAQTRNPAGFAADLGWWLDEAGRSGDLRTSRDFYRQVLAIAPSHAEARVRLARVLHQLDDLPAALAELDTLSAQGLSQELTYLSRLFRAGIEEDLGHADKAQAAYLSALEWRAQSPFVGLAALLRSGGNTAASLAVTQRLVQDAPDSDPWWSYLRGQAAHLSQCLTAARATVR